MEPTKRAKYTWSAHDTTQNGSEPALDGLYFYAFCGFVQRSRRSVHPAWVEAEIINSQVDPTSWTRQDGSTLVTEDTLGWTTVSKRDQTKVGLPPFRLFMDTLDPGGGMSNLVQDDSSPASCQMFSTLGSEHSPTTRSQSIGNTVPMKYHCKVCEENFPRRREFWRHVATQHNAIRFSCEYCLETFSRAGNLSVHVRAVHLGLKPFKCNHCSRRFSRNTAVRRHIMKVHGLEMDDPSTTKVYDREVID